MPVYVFDKKDLSIKQVSTPVKNNGYRISLDEETNGKSQFIFQKESEIVRGDFLFFNGYLFIVETAEDAKGSNLISVTCKDAINIFDRKIIQTKTEMMLESSLEEFLATMIMDNFVQNDDPVINIPYIDITIESQTQVTEPINSENLIYNFHTFMVNCRQNKNIFTELAIEQGTPNRLHIHIKNIVDDQVLVDTTVSEVTDYLKQYEVDPVAKVQCFIRDIEEVKYLFLKSDSSTTDDMDDPMRIAGRVETISVDTDEEGQAYQEMLNVFKGNRFKHLVEFKIKKSSKLVDVSKLRIGTLIKIKTKGIDIFDIYDSYISAIAFDDEEFISYKSGQLRVSLTDKLQQDQSRSIGNKLDISGGSIARLNVNGYLGGSTIDEINSKLEDTGWIDIPYISGFSAGTATQLQYRVKSNVLYIRGGATGTFTAGNYTQINHNTNGLLPPQYRPHENTRGGAMGGAMRAAGYEVTTDGRITLGFNYTSPSAPAWIAFSCAIPLD